VLKTGIPKCWSVTNGFAGTAECVLVQNKETCNGLISRERASGSMHVSVGCGSDIENGVKDQGSQGGWR
jgi:hypothetical protein